MNKNFLKNKIILITGGTGSFGNAIIKRILNFYVKEIRIISRDEKKQDDMRRIYHDERLKFYIGDVRDYDAIELFFNEVDYVFHAAALKQVPSCEFFPMEAIKTNVIGSDNVMRACIKHNIKKAIFLSTDKAAYPINAMGMSKAIMEKNVIANSMKTKDVIFMVTRYGNVMASRGSVIPLFLEQIKKDVDLTLTDGNMTRFMMTLDEAIDLVLYAFEHGQNGQIFIQKSKSTTILELAKTLLKLTKSNLRINSIGKRHGEKMYETLATVEELECSIDLDYHYVIQPDDRSLNYENYFEKGNKTKFTDSYNSNNTARLTEKELIDKLLSIEYINKEIENILNEKK